MTDAPPPYPGVNGYSGYATGGIGAGGFAPPGAAGSQSSTMTSAEAKAAEAAAVQTGYYDPNNPNTAYVPQVLN